MNAEILFVYDDTRNDFPNRIFAKIQQVMNRDPAADELPENLYEHANMIEAWSVYLSHLCVPCRLVRAQEFKDKKLFLRGGGVPVIVLAENEKDYSVLISSEQIYQAGNLLTLISLFHECLKFSFPFFEQVEEETEAFPLLSPLSGMNALSA